MSISDLKIYPKIRYGSGFKDQESLIWENYSGSISDRSNMPIYFYPRRSQEQTCMHTVGVAVFPNAKHQIFRGYKSVAYIVRRGGEAEMIQPYSSIFEEDNSKLLTIGQTLLVVDGAIETLLLLFEEGPKSIETLLENSLPNVKLFDLILSLKQCELIMVDKKNISLSLAGSEIAKKIKSYLIQRKLECSASRTTPIE